MIYKKEIIIYFEKDLKNYENNRKGIFIYFYVEKYEGDFVKILKMEKEK